MRILVSTFTVQKKSGYVYESLIFKRKTLKQDKNEPKTVLNPYMLLFYNRFVHFIFYYRPMLKIEAYRMPLRPQVWREGNREKDFWIWHNV